MPLENALVLPQVSVVICTFNGVKNGLGNCMNSLANCKYPDFEVIVVDDASKDNTYNTLLSFEPLFKKKGIEFKIVRNSVNLQLYGSKRKGVECADSNSTIICVTDDDCVVRSDWIYRHAVAHCNSDREIGYVGGDIESISTSNIYESFSAQPSNNILQNWPDGTFFHGANCSYNKVILLEIGSFNDSTVSGGDAEVCFKMQEAGFTGLYKPDAIVWHNHRSSLHKLIRQFMKYGVGDYFLYQQYGRARFLRREMMRRIFSLTKIAVHGENQLQDIMNFILEAFVGLAWWSGHLYCALNQR